MAWCIVIAVSQVSNGQAAQVTLRVADEEGHPVQGAEAVVTFEQKGDKFHTVKGPTDKTGTFVATYRDIGFISYGAWADGYYDTHDLQDRYKDRGKGWWRPWNPVLNVVLKKTINPVPMYAKKVQVELPELDRPIGFDLIEADWCAPHGRGRTTDFIFTGKKRFVSWEDFDASLEVRFLQPSDGIQPIEAPPNGGSALRLPHLAPADGYLGSYKRIQGSKPGESMKGWRKENQNFFFRVRSSGRDGQVTRAWYGKIHGDIGIDPINSKTITIMFRYYLNPDSSRNVEFDLKRNLFNDLKPREVVWQP